MRVIAGSARGRPLRAPEGPKTRPTSDKIKGVIFSMLDAEAMRRGCELEEDDEERDGRFALAVCWPRVLELYAGSGALAIEALSRGAERADLVDSDAAARRAIDANLARTGFADRARVHRLTSEQAVSTLRGPYDLILLDPPYDRESADRESAAFLARLVEGSLLAPAGVVVWEHPRDADPPATVAGAQGRRLQLVKTRTHGGGGVTLYASVDGPMGVELANVEPTRAESTGVNPMGSDPMGGGPMGGTA